MTYDERDEMWKLTWAGHYECLFQERLAERLLLRWQRFDDLSKITIAVCASGSAISGWSLWQDPNFKLTWVTIAGISALFAIVHRSLDISRKITDWKKSKDGFVELRLDFSNLLDQMKVDPSFDLGKMTKSYSDLRSRFGKVFQEITVDAFITKRLERNIQKEINTTLGV